MAGFQHLFIPGPTNIPERVRQAMNVPMRDMRAPDFGELTLPIFEGLKKAYKLSKGRVFIYPSSGTGAWEAAISNTLNVGDKVVMSHFGQFSMLWVDMAQRLGLDVDAIDVEWGKGVPLDEYEKRIAADTGHEIKAVFATHNETATGVTSDVKGVRDLLDAHNHPALLFVDGVSSVASIEFRMDDWGVDCAVSGSQKGFMLPAGLGLLGVSQKALEAHKSSKMPRCFFSFEDMMKTNDAGFFPYTPATQLLQGLQVSLEMIFEEGLEAIWARHNRLAEGARRAVAAWDGCELVSRGPEWRSDTVSAIYAPAGVDAAEVIKTAYYRYRTSLGSGLSILAGKAFRIGHLGSLNEVMVCGALSAAEMALRDCGAQIVAGSGVAAAQEYYRETAQIAAAKAA